MIKNIILAVGLYLVLVGITFDPLLSLIPIPFMVGAVNLNKLRLSVMLKSIVSGVIYTVLTAVCFYIVAYKLNFYPGEDFVKVGFRIFFWCAIAGIIMGVLSYYKLKMYHRSYF